MILSMPLIYALAHMSPMVEETRKFNSAGLWFHILIVSAERRDYKFNEVLVYRH